MSSKMKALSKRRPKHNIISMILGSVKEKNRHGHSAHGSTSGTSSSQSHGQNGHNGSSGRRPREGREASPSASSRTRSTSRQPSGSRLYDASRKNRILATAVEMTRRTKSRNTRAASAATSSSRGGGLGSSLNGGGGNKRQLLKGQRAYYKSSRGIVKVTVVGIHHDSKLEPYYTIKLKDGKEKQTDGKHLIPVAEEAASSTDRGQGAHAQVSGSGNANGNSNEGVGSNSGGREKSNHGTGNEVVTDHMSSSSSDVEELLVAENHNTNEEPYARTRPALPAPATEDHHSRSSGSDHDHDQDQDQGNASSHYNHPDSAQRRRRISRSQPTAAAATSSSSATPNMSAALQASTPGKEPDTPPYRKHQEAYYRDVVPTPTPSGMTMQSIVTKAKILEIYTDLNNKLFKHSYMIQLSCDGSKKEVRGNKLCMLMDLTSDELAEVMKEKNSRGVSDGLCGGSEAEHTIGTMGTAASKQEEVGNRRGSMPEIHKSRRHRDLDDMGRLSKSANSASREALPQQDTIDEGYEAEEGPFSSGSENSDSSNEVQNGTGATAGNAAAGTDEAKVKAPLDTSAEKKEDGKFLALPCAVQMVQANTEDGGTKIVPRYEAGMDVYYKGPNGIMEARILESHLDDLLDPYYTVRLEDGREKQTDNAHITLTKEEVVEEQALVKAGGESDNENGDNGSEGGVEDEQTLVDPQLDQSPVPLSKNANSDEQHCARQASSSTYNNHELVSASKKQDPSASVNIGALVKFSIGEEVNYNSSQGEHLRATVIKLLKDKKNRPYYVVRLQGGKEKQVYGHRLSPSTKSQSEQGIISIGNTSNNSNKDPGGSTTPPRREPTRSRSISRRRRTSINGSGTNDAPPGEQSRRRRSFVRSESISSRSSRKSSSRRDASEDSRKSRPTSQDPRGSSNNNTESSSRGNRGHSVARRSRSKSVRSRRDLDSSGHGPDRTNADRGHSTSRRSRSRAPSDSNLAMSTRTHTDRRPTTPGISHTSRIIYPPEEGGGGGSRSEKMSRLGGFRKSFSVGRSK